MIVDKVPSSKITSLMHSLIIGLNIFHSFLFIHCLSEEYLQTSPRDGFFQSLLRSLFCLIDFLVHMLNHQCLSESSTSSLMISNNLSLLIFILFYPRIFLNRSFILFSLTSLILVTTFIFLSG